MRSPASGSSVAPTRPSAELKAWAALGANLLVLPGLGSLVAGRFRSGLVQCLVALAGFGMTAVWLVDVVALMRASGTFLLDPPPDVRLGLAGIAAFGAAWLWSAATGWSLVRRARDTAAAVVRLEAARASPAGTGSGEAAARRQRSSRSR